MVAIIHLLATFIADVFKSRRRLEVENLFLRHQLNIALRRAPQRPRLRAGDRALMVWMTRMSPSLIGLTRVVQPATILRWHRRGFRAYWRWKSRAARQAQSRARVAQSHPADERRQSIVGGLREFMANCSSLGSSSPSRRSP